jgi:DNA-directed RNA polymerase subunit RPC12/RpoP
MEKSTNTWKISMEDRHSHESGADFKCGECGEEFEKPLVAKLSSLGNVRTYYACPRCLTQVQEVKTRREERSEESSLEKEPKRIEVKSEEKANCQHFLGYLKRRPKNTSVPEDCLTCEKMVECMVC